MKLLANWMRWYRLVAQRIVVAMVLYVQQISRIQTITISLHLINGGHALKEENSFAGLEIVQGEILDHLVGTCRAEMSFGSLPLPASFVWAISYKMLCTTAVVTCKGLPVSAARVSPPTFALPRRT